MKLFRSSKTNLIERETNSIDVMPVKSPFVFFMECVNSFHKEALKFSYALKGSIFVPELLSLGKFIVTAFLDDYIYKLEYRSDPRMYHYSIMTVCFECGVLFSHMWYHKMEILKSGFVETVLRDGPKEKVNPLLKKYFLMDSLKQECIFTSNIFAKWSAMLEPYWNCDDCSPYIVNATLAAFQLGVSMTLEKLNY